MPASSCAPVVVELNAQQARRSADDLGQFRAIVKIQMIVLAEAVAQRRTQAVPDRVVAPTSVNGFTASRIERAPGPLPTTMLSSKSSIAG